MIHNIEEDFKDILTELGFVFDEKTRWCENNIKEEDLLELMAATWNLAVEHCSVVGYNFGKGVETEEEILNLIINNQND